MSVISNYIVASWCANEEVFKFLCERLKASTDGNAAPGVASEFAAHNGKTMGDSVMLFCLNYVGEDEVLEAVRAAPWEDPGLETVQVFASHEDRALFLDVTPWEVVDYG